MADKFKFDPTTNIGKVRILIGDRNPDEWIFSDDEIQAFIDLNSDNLYFAAADALETMAANDAMIQKRIRLNDLSDDRVSISRELRLLAAQKREQAEKSSGFESFNLPKTRSEDYV